jgi:Tfp pilus assembly protein PilV
MNFSSTTRRNKEGAVLLEVVLSLLLFVAAVAVVSSALNASMETMQRQRFSMHAANLAATMHAEIDMGLRGTDVGGPEPFEKPFEGWTWQIGQRTGEMASDGNGLASVEVIIRNTNSPAVYRLAQLHKERKGVVKSATTEVTP